MTIESFCVENTYDLGKKLGLRANVGDIYALKGDLGVGKTVFVKGFAAGLGIIEPITSPTFTILHSYSSGRIPLYHFDVYRIMDVCEMEEIGYEDYFFGEGVTLVEWPDIIEELLPKYVQRISIIKNLKKGFDYRLIEIEGDKFEDIII